ncbi:MAG: acyl-CoA mutase large subunit family protein [Terriglobales bacterium]
MASSRDSERAAHPGLYRRDDLAGFDPERELGEPGAFPFTRGVQPTMYRGRLWTMRQYAGYADAEESNRRYKYLLAQGTTGLSIAFDLPTQIGLDSDHELAAGEIGRVGVPIANLGDMERLLDGIPLDRVSSSMTINATAAILLAYYVAVAKKQGADPRRLSGTVQNDILKEYIARGTYIYPVAPALRVVTDIFEYGTRELPEWNTISISGYHMREAGCTAAQEVAFTLANGAVYVAAALERGLEVDAFAPRLSFFFNAHNDLLEEAAKFRAARRIWARTMKERFGAKNPRSMMLRFHAQTAGSTLTAQQPLNNVARTAYQALAAVLGGTQSLHTNSYDEALGLPTEAAALLAVRTQQLLAHESGVAAYIDPLAGSYCVESLTNRLESEAEEYLARIAALGGMLRAIETGFVQKEIQNAAYADQRQVESGERVVVGVNRYRAEEETPMPAQRIDPERERAQIARLREWRARRDWARAEDALAAVGGAAAGRDNLLPPILAAVEAGATTGEIADALRRVFGEYREAVTV